MQDPIRTTGWRGYTKHNWIQNWCRQVQGKQPAFACCFGFTASALVPGISAAGATPTARRYTALADAEVLLRGYASHLPTSPDGYPSPVVISRAIQQSLQLPTYLFDCGLPTSLAGLISVGNETADCLSTGRALSLATVQKLFLEGWIWGEKLSSTHPWIVIGECVAAGTSTALALLLGLGYAASNMVNSSHPVCNHAQKLALVQQGLSSLPPRCHPLEVIAAVGDPMQPFVAGLAMRASQSCPVLLAGGTQMLTVYALMHHLDLVEQKSWQPEQVVVGTTRWVAEDPSGNTVALAQLVGSPLMATRLSFQTSRFPQLRAYEQGYVKEGVGAGGLAIAADLYVNWAQETLLQTIEQTYEQLLVFPEFR
ncbi:MAG: TIGR00303 family protein [Synechococcaceae cyanobacterium SM2_3_1]|nr:TIGR00303 family protein [Synechococcaceae cyanobacterium SM2_3_1]